MADDGKMGGAGDFVRGAADRMRQAGEAVRDTGQKAMENNQAIGLKMIDQAETNAHEAFAAMRRAAQASDLSTVMQVQAEYLREQSSRSMAQAREIGELIARFGRDAIGAMRGAGQGGSGQDGTAQTGAGPRTGGE
jgi:hypothetical protein